MESVVLSVFALCCMLAQLRGVGKTITAEKEQLMHSFKFKVGRVRRDTEKTDALVAGGPASAASTKEVRSALAAQFRLAASLHTEQFPFYAKRLEVDEQRQLTLEQIWGQLNVLLAPIITRVRSNLDAFEDEAAAAEKHHADEVDMNDAAALSDEVDADDDDNDVSAGGDSEMGEDWEDVLQAKMAAARGTKKSKKNDDEADPEAWRYAFGQDGDDDDEEMSEDDVDANETNSERRARLRNRQALDDVDKEENEEEGNGKGIDEDEDEEEVDLEDEKAALKELYGSDFSDDDARLGDVEEEEAEDEEGFEGSGDEEGAVFNEDEAKYWGRDDILNDEDRQFGDQADGMATDEDAVEEEAIRNDPNLSPFEKERLLEQRRVEKLENARLYNADWAMGGEVSGVKRPKDSLIDTTLDFEHGMKPVPVVTEASTMKLEERIKRRIVEKLFDDVKRRQPRSTADDLVATRKDNAIDSEKSKLSLMDLYEKEYMDKLKAAEGPNTSTAEPLTEIEKDELRAIQMWKRLSQHLDALSNFFFTPKPVQQDLDARVRAVEHQAPAIVVETVGNFAMNRENALAPQDLYRPAANHAKVGVSVDEMDPREKRALRRAKKESFAATSQRKEKQQVERKAVTDKAKAVREAQKLAAEALKRKGGRR